MTVADSKTRLINLLIELWLNPNYPGCSPFPHQEKIKQSPPHALISGSNNITFLNKIHPL